MKAARRDLLAVVGGGTSALLGGCIDTSTNADQSENTTSKNSVLPTNLLHVQRNEIELPALSIDRWPQSVTDECSISSDEIDDYRGIARTGHDGDVGYHPLQTVRNLMRLSVYIQLNNN